MPDQPQIAFAAPEDLIGTPIPDQLAEALFSKEQLREHHVKRAASDFANGMISIMRERQMGLEAAIETATNWVVWQIDNGPGCAPDCENDCEAVNREALVVAAEDIRGDHEKALRVVESGEAEGTMTVVVAREVLRLTEQTGNRAMTGLEMKATLEEPGGCGNPDHDHLTEHRDAGLPDTGYL